MRIQVLRNSNKLLNLQEQFGYKENCLSFTSTPTHGLPVPPKDKIFKGALSDSGCSVLFFWGGWGGMGYELLIGLKNLAQKIEILMGYGRPNCKIGFIVYMSLSLTTAIRTVNCGWRGFFFFF